MKTAVLGNFDGFHIGHRALMEKAKEKGLPVLCWSFEPKNGDIFAEKEKIALLKAAGADEIYLASFEAVKDKSPEEFVKMLREMGVTHAVCGFNFTFGKDRAGNAETLLDLMNGDADIVGEVKAPLDGREVTVCSTLIRKLLKEGRTEDAVRLMGHPYIISGSVNEGKKLGRTIGFPTVNQNIGGMLPRLGVYGGYTTLGGREYRTVTNIGTVPTFGGETAHAETHIVGYAPENGEELYGTDLTVCLTRFIRDEKRFSGAEELMRQIEKDLNE